MSEQSIAQENGRRLFISYGHPESMICKRIKTTLEERGYSTWFDRDRLHEGSEWREEIVRGIQSSNGVVACLSRHTARPLGVCLDELNIAVALKDGNIVTVLLDEDSADFHVPAMVNHIQWLDMTAWRKMAEQGDAAFERWFGERMDALCRILESRGTLEFEGQLTTLKKKLSFATSNARWNELMTKPFVGRAWLAELVEGWRSDPDGEKICLITGAPGIGKSAFMANYAACNAHAVATIFCDGAKHSLSSPRMVIQTLAYLLACRLRDYRRTLIERLEKTDSLDEFSEADLFDRLIGDPLEHVIDGQRDTVCLVIDGLDECGTVERNVLADTLAKYAGVLPRWLRILITSREVDGVTTSLTGCRRIVLQGRAEQNQADVRDYFVRRLERKFGGDARWLPALDALTERSGGIFLYAHLMAEALEQGHMTLEDPDTFPTGLAESFRRWFGWMFRDDALYKRKYRDAISCILASPVPLPEKELAAILGWRNTECYDFVALIRVLLHQETDLLGGTTIRFSHKYISDWLQDEISGVYRCDAEDGIHLMAEAFYDCFTEDGAKELSPYAAVYLCPFLAQARMRRQWEKAAGSAELCERVINQGAKLSLAGKAMENYKLITLADEYAQKAAARWADSLPIRRVAAKYALHQGALLLGWRSLQRAEACIDRAIADQEAAGGESGLAEDLRTLAELYGMKNRLLRIKDSHERKAWAEKKHALLTAIAEKTGLEADWLEVARNLRREAAGQTFRQEETALRARSRELLEELAQRFDSAACYAELARNYDYEVPDFLDPGQRLPVAIKAANAWEKAVAREENDAACMALCSAYETIGDCLRRLKRTDEAIAWYRKSLDVQERKLHRYRWIGSAAGKDLFEMLGRMEAERENHTEAYGWYSKAAETHLNRRDTDRIMDRYTDAARACAKAAEAARQINLPKEAQQWRHREQEAYLRALEGGDSSVVYKLSRSYEAECDVAGKDETEALLRKAIEYEERWIRDADELSRSSIWRVGTLYGQMDKVCGTHRKAEWLKHLPEWFRRVRNVGEGQPCPLPLMDAICEEAERMRLYQTAAHWNGQIILELERQLAQQESIRVMQELHFRYWRMYYIIGKYCGGRENIPWLIRAVKMMEREEAYTGGDCTPRLAEQYGQLLRELRGSEPRETLDEYVRKMQAAREREERWNAYSATFRECTERGDDARRKNDWPTAEAWYEKALVCCRSCEPQSCMTNLTNLAEVCRNLARIAEYRADWPTAKAYHQERIAVLGQLADRGWIPSKELLSACEALSLGVENRNEWSEAQVYLEKQLALCEQMIQAGEAEHDRLLRYREELSAANRAMGRLEEAEAQCCLGFAAYDAMPEEAKLKARSSMACLCVEMSYIAGTRNDLEKAQEWRAKADTWRDKKFPF